MNATGVLLTFSGIDGAGKTSLAIHVAKQLGCSEIPLTEWVKFGDHPLVRVSQALREHLKRSPSDRAPSGLSHRSVPLLLVAYFWVAHLAMIHSRVSWPLRRGRKVICDRYVYDTVVDLCVDLGRSYEGSRRMVAHLRPPCPDLAFWIDVSPELAVGRKGEEYALRQMQARQQAYARVAKDYGLVRIDGSSSLNSLVAEVLGLVKRIDRGGKAWPIGFLSSE